MVRKINIKGFTIIELLVTISIMSILMAIGIPNFFKWKTKRNIENDIKKIYTLLQKYRIKAFSEKISYNCSFAPDGKTFFIQDSNNTTVESLSLSEPFTFKSSNIVLDIRGTFSGSSIIPLDTSSVPQYNCLAVDDTRIKLGRWNISGNKCDVK